MLYIIRGAAKSGKTSEVFKRLEAAVGSGKKALLIVPEQASFDNERRLEQTLGAHRGMAQAMSFSRFAQRVSESLGGCGKPLIAPFAEYFLMSTALDEAAGELEVYKKNCYTRGFIEQMLSMVEELQNAGISHERLWAAAVRLETPDMQKKIAELALIYDSYQTVLRQSCVSQYDAMKNAADRLRESSLLSSTEVFIDDFGSFTAPELELISAFLRCAGNVTVSICGGDYSDSPALELSRDTELKRLCRMAEQAGVGVEKTVLETSCFSTRAMAAMEKAQRRELRPDCPDNDGAVTAVLCDSAYDELEEIAAGICRLAAQGMRYREMAVIARDLGRYRAALPTVFGRFGLPFFVDERGDARTSLLTNGVLAAVKAACGAREADWLELARSPLMGLDSGTVNSLENYCYVWSVSFSQWKKPFVKSPSGMSGKMSGGDLEMLERLNAARLAVTGPVLRLADEIKSGSGGRIARGLWGFLQEIAAARRIKEFARSVGGELADTACAEREQRAFLDEQELLWQQLVAFLELFDSLGETVSFSPERVCELTELCFGGFETALIPRALDEVTVGTAQRMRCQNVRAAFLPGAVQGEFPAAAKPEGLLSEHERKLLCEGGLELLNEGDRRQNTEKLFCYRAVTAPTERLFVTCPRRELSGEELLPSEIFERAAALTIQKEKEPFGRIWSAEGLERAVVSSGEESRGQMLAAARSILGHERAGELCGRKKPEHRIDDRAAAAALFGEEISISPSRLEQYYRCPFSFFMQKGMGASKLKRAELSPANSGTIIHRILERVAAEWGGGLSKPVSDGSLMRAIRAEAMSYIEQCAGPLDEVPARLKGNVELLCGRLFEMIKNLADELTQSEFSPVALELKIGRGGQIAPVELMTGDGRRIYAEGTVDRVDSAIIGGENYIRVIDYKSGAKKFELADACSGLNLQLLIYLFSLTAQGASPPKKGGGTSETAKAAGALYLPAQSGYVTVSHGAAGDRIERSVREQYRMNGLLLDDQRVLAAMEKNLEGRYIPYKQGQKARGESPLYSSGELDKMKKLVYKKIREMAERLYDGRIEASPLCKKELSPCGYCDFRAACGFEEGDAVRQQKAVDRAEALAEGEKRDGR